MMRDPGEQFNQVHIYMRRAVAAVFGFFLCAVGTYGSFAGILVNDIRIGKMQSELTPPR